MKKTKFKIILFAIVLILVLALISIIFYMKKSKISYIDLSSNITKNTSQNINMEYLYSENIGINVKEISISDNSLNFIFSLKQKNNNIPSTLLNTNIIIYDDNRNIYCNSFQTTGNTNQKVKIYDIEKLNDKNNLLSGSSYSIISKTENEATLQLLSYSPIKPFAQTKKIYIHIYDLEYTNSDGEKITLHPEWYFSVNIEDLYTPAKKYKFKENISDFNLSSIYISDYFTTIIYDTTNDSNISIVDNNGNSFQPFTSSNVQLFKKSTYTFNTSNITQPLYLRISNESFTKDIELEEIK